MARLFPDGESLSIQRAREAGSGMPFGVVLSMRSLAEANLPPELQRYTVTPVWMDRQMDDERRQRALKEFQARLSAPGR